MPSLSLQQWSTARATALDEIEGAHQSIGGTGPGRRYATQQINQAYAVLLASQFQGFCRDLHTECVDFLVGAGVPPPLHRVFRNNFRLHRRLQTGNANPANIGADFNRFGLVFWTEVEQHDTRNTARRQLLEALITWRNAIAHQDFDPAKLGGRTTLQLQEVRSWRGACDGLARSFDSALRIHLRMLTGSYPW
jgi:hypothetical protein